MALYLRESDVRALLPMEECITVLEELFRQEAAGQAENRPRRRIRLPGGFHHLMAGAAPGFKAFGLKSYTSFRGPTTPLVLLYDLESGALSAVVEAGVLGQVRTGAATGVATRHMAAPDASEVGVIGTGYQARAQVEAVCRVRPVRRVKAYSRTPEKREQFAARMGEALGVEVVPVASAEECVRGSHVVITITSARDPVFDGAWLEPGAHVNAAGSNHWMRREVDEATIQRAALVVVDNLEQAQTECGELLWAVERGAFRWSRAVELKDVVAGRVPGRPSPEAVTLFESQGLAIEDVAAAAYVVQRARERGVGQELPL